MNEADSKTADSKTADSATAGGAGASTGGAGGAGADTGGAGGAGAGNTATPRPKLDEFGGTIGHGQVRTIRAPWMTSTIPRVRKALVADLTAREIADETIDESELVASELMTNALRHARPLGDGCMRVRWKVRGEVVEVEVTDGGGDTVPKPAPQAVWLSSGRGLRIIRSVAHEWGVGDDGNGVTVWAALGGPSRRRAT